MLSYKKLFKTLALTIAMLVPILSSAAPAYYNKHIVLVVDQTPKTNYGGYLTSVGNDLLRFFNGTLQTNDKFPKDFKFNPEEDLLEVFTYGLTGNVSGSNHNGVAANLQVAAQNGLQGSALYRATLKGLVHNYTSVTDIESLEQWWNSALTGTVFNLNTKLAKDVNYSLSAFLPYAVVPYIDKSIPAKEYYIISVSTFQAGLVGQLAQYDIDILSQIYGSLPKAIGFNKWLETEFSNPYQISDWLHISQGSQANFGVSAVGKKFVLSSAAQTTVSINSNITLTQEAHGSKTFTVGPISVSFPKDDNLEIDNITLTVANGDETYTQTIDEQAYSYNSDKREYVLNPGKITFNNKVNENSNLLFNIVFTPKNEANSNLLTYVFTASREVSGNAIEFVPMPESYKWVVIACLVLAGLIAWGVFNFRKRYARNQVKLNVWPISNSRYMDVSDNKVVNYDCWYFHPGEKERSIQVTGNVKIEYPKFAKKLKLVAEFMIEDIDQNDDFSFRPYGTLQNGAKREAKEWYPLQTDANGDFDFDVVAYLQSALEKPNFERDDLNILRLKVSVRTHFETSDGKVASAYTQVEKRYLFIVRPEIENSDIWVSLDPGTSGSCIAYGFGGLPADTNNINLAASESTNTAGETIISPIFYSKIKITDYSRLFSGTPINDLEPFDDETGTGDFFFGNQAHIRYGRNSFQSIKKLLGYTNKLEIQNDKGQIESIEGQELAHLLVKGLCRQFELFVLNNNSVKPEVRQRMLTNGHLSPSRAIVAVPNNYTVNKVQAMINTIKDTHLFKEVHYVFEAEGVMMHFMNLNWGHLSQLEHKTFVVFDMGGATINATAFRLEVHKGVNKGTTYIRSITVDTISRVGYTVGGDNIDFALIDIILDIPSVKDAIANGGTKREDIMRKHKKVLIAFAQRLKLDYIDAINGTTREGNWAKDEQALWTQIFNLVTNDFKLSCPAEADNNDIRFLKSRKAKQKMHKLVHDCVKDAINELLNDRFSTNVELILSGRSVLYPGIKETVVKTLSDAGFAIAEWDYNGATNKEEVVKTAVVRGACWYAMNSKYVDLRHDTVTSTFGYTDMVDGAVKFIPVIEKNSLFDENGEVSSMVEPQDPTISTVKFLQMLGSNFDEIYNSPELLHKMAELTQIPQSQIHGNIKSIKIKVDSNNNFSYEISIAGESRPITGTCKASDADITDTNSEAYAFAALASLDDETVSENDNTPTVARKTRTHNTGRTGGARRI